MAAAPASSIRRTSSGALISLSSQPARIFTVTGIFTAFAIALTIACACEGSRIRLQPALCFAIFDTGQPMLTSTMSAPMPSTICAAAAIFCGSPPKIWIETGRSSSVYSAYSSVRSMPRTIPSELTISVTTSPQPPRRFTRRRKAVSVMPAIGASANGCSRLIEPIFTSHFALISLDIRGVDFDADGLADEIDGENEARVRPLACEPPHDPLQGAVRHFDHHAFTNQRAGIELEFALHQPPDALDLVLRYRHDVAVERDDVHDAGALQDGQPLVAVEAHEAVPGEERPVDLLLAVFPVAPARNRREKGFETLPFELLAHDLLVARARPEGVPRRGVVHGDYCLLQTAYCELPAGSAAICFSYAFFSSSFFHSMIACVRRRARNFFISVWVRAPATLSAIRSRTASNGWSACVLSVSSLKIW